MKKFLRYTLLALIAFLLLSVCLIFLRPSTIITRAEAKKEYTLPSSHFLNWRGAELHYTDEGHGQPILMIHGFGGSLRNFSAFAASLQDSFRIIRIDLPGFGLSDLPALGENPDYVKMYSDYISFMLDTLHLDSLYVIGNSMGGGIAWLTAADHPDKVHKLVLLNSAGYDVASVASKLLVFRFKSFGHVFDKGMPMFLSEAGLKKCFADKSKVDPNIWQLNNHFSNREGNLQNMLALARSGQFPDSTLIQKVQCPTLIIWGKEDAIVPVEHAEKFHRDIKNSRLIIYNPCGHVPMMERTQDLKKDFLTFVRSN